ncbi:afadin [Thunnus albacares]|uniref:afadin n=1 Tax=Thunnus albacares TaxID=8236 RepID=UPI001CF64624|nr:afadin [Thunnus albacares]
MPEEEEREKLAKVIRQWNNNRLDLFEISQPDENLEFHGVMRFYFEDHVGDNVATKCLRVCSSSSTREVIETLSEKFRPDLKMLSTCYCLYEIHTSKERKLDLDERPLVVQLNWNSDNREGRFVLKKDKESLEENCHEKEKGGVIQNFKRTLSRKEKKKEKNTIKATDEATGDENGSTEKPLNNTNICVSNPETKKWSTEYKKQQQSQADPGVKHTGSLHPDFLDQPGLPLGIKFCDNCEYEIKYFVSCELSDLPSHNVLLPPAGVFYISAEEAFLSAVINYTNSSTVHFKLSPAYILYAVGRFALQRWGSPPSGKTHGVTSIANKMVAMTGKVIQASLTVKSHLPSSVSTFAFQRQQAIAGALAFWMANSSELLNFLKHDKDLGPLTQQSQLDLSHLVHKAYSCLIQCLQNELRKHLPTFLIDPEQHGPLPAGIELVLNTLMNTMSLLRRCRVNPALTIQLFSQLFHFISAWLFNQLMSPEADTPGLRSHYWGAALRQRLTAIEAWAERQGLELAADCHLGHIIQATMLLTMKKYSMQDAKDIQNTCFKLNSLQLQTLLAGYLYATNEPHIPPDLINAVVTAAEASADNLIRSEGRDIQLQESLDLHLPFLLPEGGYSCDTVRGIPPGFREFLEPIYRKGLCSLTSQPNSKGDWTVYFSESTSSAGTTYMAVQREPEIVTITLKKPLNSGMGVSIVAAKGAGQDNLGIYIKSIVRGGPAEMNGKLTAGDQLLSVDGRSLVGLSQERAAAIMVQTGPVVTLQVAKFGASYHGLGALLNEPTPERTAGDKSHAKPNSNALMLHSVLDPGHSEQLESLHGSSRRKKDQIMQRNRELYRSNPNMTTHFALEDEAEPVDPVVRGNNIAAVSTINLCTDTFHREYLTLPNPKSQDKNISESSRPQQMFKVSLRPLDGQNSSDKRTFMRQALSQENLCVDNGGPLLDKRQNMWQDQSAKQTMSHYSSFPIRPSYSSHDILSDNSSPTKRQQESRTSGAGVWRTPFSQHPTPTPSIQPSIRIDIPVTRAASAQSNPPLTTFQQSSSLLAVKKSQMLKVHGQTSQAGQKQSPQTQAYEIYACPISATKKLPQPSLLTQQQRPGTHGGQAAKPQVSITPTKHVSFQEPPTQQKQGTGPMRQKDLQELSDPWRREAQEKLEKQQRLQVVELLEQEVQELQAKEKRTAEENDRLRKLSLEWQFQKRLQEVQQRGEDEEEDEDLDMMMMIQQLEKRVQNKRSSEGKVNSELKEQTGSLLSQKEEKAKTDQRPIGRTQDVNNMASKE